jgi:FixJ family two-component response regulator
MPSDEKLTGLELNLKSSIAVAATRRPVGVCSGFGQIFSEKRLVLTMARCISACAATPQRKAGTAKTGTSMLATISHPTVNHRPIESETDGNIFVYWYAENRDLVDRVDFSKQTSLRLVRGGNLENRSPGDFSTLPPCQIIVLEVAPVSLSTADAEGLLEQLSRIIEASLRQKNYPTVICIGHQLPSECVARWMQKGLFTYLERSHDGPMIFRALCDAEQHSSRRLEQYRRLQKLRQIWRSLTPEEAEVLEMIFDGIPNKAIAKRMDVSERTVEARRQRVFQKFSTSLLPIIVQAVCEWKYLNDVFSQD